MKATDERFHEAQGNLQPPNERFDGKMGEVPTKSLQLCFDQYVLGSFGKRLHGSEDREISLMLTLDMARPAVQGITRHATFIWSGILHGGPILSTSLIGRESLQLLQTLLISAADTGDEESGKAHSIPSPSATCVRR